MGTFDNNRDGHDDGAVRDRITDRLSGCRAAGLKTAEPIEDTNSTSGRAAKELSPSLAELFLAALPEERRVGFTEIPVALEEDLRTLLSEARALNPQLESAAFLAFIARSLSFQGRDRVALLKLRIGELLLVYGYGRGDPAAIEAVENQFLPQIERSLRSYSLSALDMAEILQTLRQRLWASHVPQPGMAPYSGRGELLGWLRVTALREAGHLNQRARRNVEVPEQEFLEAGHLAGSPDLQLLKAQYRQGFRQAFDTAMSALSSRDRNLLRYTYIDNLTIDEVAVIYKVHRATVARWLTQTREALQKQTRKNLQQQRGLAGVNLEEILQLIWSQLEVSVRHHLLVHTE